MIRAIIFLGFIFFNFSNLFSQDTIVKRDNERIVCKIKEIGTDEIKYQLINNDILIGIDKDDVSKVVLSSGLTMTFQKSMDDKNNYKDQRKNCFKFRLFSPLYGYSDFTYERSIKPGSSFECSLGAIGLGKHYFDNLSGVSFRIGYKFIKSPDFYLSGLRYAHILKGLYFRPEIATSTYKKEDEDIFAAAILFNVGNQWIFNNIIALDFYFGLGYGYSSNNSFNIQYGYSTGAKEFPIAISSGFRLGFLIK